MEARYSERGMVKVKIYFRVLVYERIDHSFNQSMVISRVKIALFFVAQVLFKL